jgi:hypothetical protein
LKFKKITSKNKLKEYAQIIYERYLEINSNLEVNIDESLRFEVLKKIKNDQIDSTIFDSIQFALQLNLLDTFSRLKEETNYKRFENNFKIEKDLLYREEKFQ